MHIDNIVWHFKRWLFNNKYNFNENKANFILQTTVKEHIICKNAITFVDAIQ